MLKDLTPVQASLADLMSRISERCYAAGWMQNLEYVLWDAQIKGGREYGQDFITQDDIAALKTLSNKAGCWIFFDDKSEETAIDLNSWQNKFQAETQNNPSLLIG
jgi:hypothetical protein